MKQKISSVSITGNTPIIFDKEDNMIKTAWAFSDSAYLDNKITAPIPNGAKILHIAMIQAHERQNLTQAIEKRFG